MFLLAFGVKFNFYEIVGFFRLEIVLVLLKISLKAVKSNYH